MTVIEFLEARLAEDEAIALAAVYVEQEWRVENVSDKVRVTSGGEFTEDADGDYYFGAHPVVDRFDVPISRHQLVHIAHHDPARVLREVAAKRAMIAEFVNQSCMSCSSSAGGDDIGDCVAQMLAAAYSDHPDFDPVWVQ